MLNHYLSKNKSLLRLIPYILISLGFILVGSAFISTRQQTERNRQQGLVGQTYNRATNCFLAVPVSQRTVEYIHSCYDRAEKATGKKVERFGN